VGDDAVRAIDAGAVVKALGAGAADAWVVDLPEPLAAVVDYLGEQLSEREFVPTAELVEALEVEPTTFGREMGELGCRPIRQYVQEGDATRRVRGYLTAEITAAVDEIGSANSEHP
jgi:S-DNA-T family DNA segregation ATPase FtsK/SpoIIIE